MTIAWAPGPYPGRRIQPHEADKVRDGPAARRLQLMRVLGRPRGVMKGCAELIGKLALPGVIVAATLEPSTILRIIVAPDQPVEVVGARFESHPPFPGRCWWRSPIPRASEHGSWSSRSHQRTARNPITPFRAL